MVRGGGDGIMGHATCDDGLVIDLSLMRGVTVDPVSRVARASGGALLAELDQAAQAHGLVCPVGTVGHTGVAGLALGGGVGRLQRRYGLTLDNLEAVELVTADGRLVRASEQVEPDLFWAIRGAGPNFGVVTALEFRLHPFGPELVRGIRIYRPSDALGAWHAFRHVLAAAPRELGLSFVVGRAVPAEEYEADVAGGPIAVIAFTYLGNRGGCSWRSWRVWAMVRLPSWTRWACIGTWTSRERTIWPMPGASATTPTAPSPTT